MHKGICMKKSRFSVRDSWKSWYTASRLFSWERAPETFYLVKAGGKWLTADDIKRYRKAHQEEINKLEKIYKEDLSTLKQYYETVTVLKQFLSSIPSLSHIGYTSEHMKIYRLKLNKNEFQVTQKQVEAELTRFQNIIQHFEKRESSTQAHLKKLKNWLLELPSSFDDYDLDSRRTRKSSYQVGTRALANSIIFAKDPLTQPDTNKEEQQKCSASRRVLWSSVTLRLFVFVRANTGCIEREIN